MKFNTMLFVSGGAGWLTAFAVIAYLGITGGMAAGMGAEIGIIGITAGFPVGAVVLVILLMFFDKKY
jgi:hypothetical protein